jgi:hypothetical protein
MLSPCFINKATWSTRYKVVMKPSLKENKSSYTPQEAPQLPTRGDTTPPCENTVHCRTAPTKPSPERIVCPLTSICGAPILPADNKGQERWHLRHVSKIEGHLDHPTPAVKAFEIGSELVWQRGELKNKYRLTKWTSFVILKAKRL